MRSAFVSPNRSASSARYATPPRMLSRGSNGHMYAVSRKGARGLMQLMPATARRLGVKSPFDPRDNIRGGVAYLAELAERFGETNADLILAAYNAGERAVEELSLIHIS